MYPEADWKPWGFSEIGLVNRDAYNAMQMNIRTNLHSKNDLTPRQIEWCRAHIPMFAEMQRLRGL